MVAVLAVVSLAGAAGSADARPKRRDAKEAFDRGVAAYQKGNFQGASEALEKSFELERDVDTLFAWAQTERKLDHCDKAIDLYQQLLTFNLPVANKSAVESKLAECRTIIAQQAPKQPPAPTSAQQVSKQPERTPSEPAAPPAAPPAPSGPAVTPPSAPVAGTTPGAPPPETPPAEPVQPYNWLTDPIALSLLGAGVVGLGVGGGYLAAAHAASNDAKAAKTYQQVLDANAKVDQRNKIGGTGMIVGGVLVAGGVGWIVWKRHDSGEQRTVTGWLAPGGGGLAITGPF